MLTATISDAGLTKWSRVDFVFDAFLLVAIPPLVLWLAWLASSSRTNNADENALDTRAEQRQLQAKEPRIGIVDTSTLKRRSREEI